MRRLWADYRHAYADCNNWLAAHCLPWRWFVDTYRAAQSLRDDI